MAKDLQELQRSFDAYVKTQRVDGKPAELYEPFDYMMSLGGKRTRPLLVSMAYELFGKDSDDVLPQAFAVELFHNFTLVHDDIMDAAALRRGAKTVHVKYGLPSAILSGDAMLVYAYRYLSQNNEADLSRLIGLFNAMAIGVCEGQQLDLTFESRGDVSSDEYIEMIKLKTALLLGTALQIGAELAHASEKDAKNLFEFGINTGIAFQLLDDLLDAFGDEERVGKTSGGDIVQNKKTILYLEALKNGNAEQRKLLTRAYESETNRDIKLKTVKQLFVETKALERTNALVARYHEKAIAHLYDVSVNDDAKKNLRSFSEMLMQRTH